MQDKLTGRERLLRTFRHEKVDRVPIAPFLYFNTTYEMFRYKPAIDTFFNPPDFDPITRFIEYCSYFGFDVLHSLGSVWDYHTAYNSTNDRSFVRSAVNWDVTIQENRRGDDEKQRTVTIRTPEGDLHLAEEYKRSSPYLVVSAPVEYPIKTKHDFEIMQRYAPPADDMDCSLVRRASEVVGDDGLVSTCMHGVFNQAAQFRKLEDLLVDPLDDEGFYRNMMEAALERVVLRAKKVMANGGEVIECAANLAGSGVGPRYYRQYVMAYENRLMQALHGLGAKVIFHNCGDAAKIMHLYNEMDMDVWGYLTPPPFGDVDLNEALRVIRPDMVLRGNIDQVEFMMKATPSEVKERVRQVLETVKPRGNFILSTTDFFFDATPYQNIQAFADAGREYGWY